MNEISNPFPFTGLSDGEVIASRSRSGANKIISKEKNSVWTILKDVLTEPMFVLLIIAASIYFLMGKVSEGLFMLGAVLLEVVISVYQDARSRKALAALKAYTQVKAKAIRNNKLMDLLSEEIVVGDIVVVEEGQLIPADGEVVHAHDFSVNESVLTGESMAVSRDESDEKINKVSQGTLAVSGLAVVRVTEIGAATRVGQIQRSIEGISEEKTSLQIQIGKFVRNMAIAGGVVFLIIMGLNWYQTGKLLDSLLKSLTLAMSILPEEIPVAFTSFMALGAWRLTRLGIIVKQTKTIETLGSADVICIDKTGTITENRMKLADVYVYQTGQRLQSEVWDTPEVQHLLTIAMWASEPVPFDPMEVALHNAYQSFATDDQRPHYNLVHEYPLSGTPPMMTHVFENAQGDRIIAAKGAAESIVRYSNLSDADKTKAIDVAHQMSATGYRVLGVAVTTFSGNDFKKEQQQYVFDFLGFVSFYDPPKPNINQVLNQFYAAGINVKIITGDNAVTTSAIASSIGFIGSDKSINGEDLLKLSDDGLKEVLNQTNIYTRMFPEAKLRIINALKDQHHIVAMVGDGVNDAPALKAANIGIAMGKKGSEPAKQASALILTDDDLGRMIDAIAMGRKIYSNLKKAIQYIISIHVPIILTVTLPLLLGWVYPNIFSPLHVIFLELVMGPTCSLVYENEPLEKGSMDQPPRHITSTFFQWSELLMSIIQGLVITCGTLGIYQYAVMSGSDENLTRAMVFTTLVVANIILTLVDRSLNYSVFTALRYKNTLLLIVLALTVTFLIVLLYVPFVQRFFGFERMSWMQLGISVLAGFVSVIWFEFYKLIKGKVSSPKKVGVI